MFGALGLALGVANSVIVFLSPFVLRAHGISVDRIAEVVAIASIPNVWYFLYSPLVDIGLSRRTWVITGATSAAVLAASAIFAVNSSLSWVIALLFASGVMNSVISASAGALMSSLPETVRGSASGWYQSGNLGGGAAGGGVLVWLAERLSLWELGIAAAMLIIVPSLVAVRLREATTPEEGHTLRGLFADIGGILSTRQTWLGLVFILSPVSSAAVGNLISGLGPDYKASASEVTWVSGIAAGILSAIGSLVGGWACNRIDKRLAYALAGPFAAIFGAYLAFAPKTPQTFAWGHSGYSLAAGFGYAVFTALVLDLIGSKRHGAATAYSFLVAGGNVPILYMTWLDGVAYKRQGVTGLMSFDALGNGLVGVALLFLALLVRKQAQRQSSST